VALDRDVEKIRAEAEAEAEEILAHARSEAYRVQRETDEARTAAVLARKQSREEAERSLSEMTSQRDDMLEQLRKTCGSFLEVVTSLAASIEKRPEDRPDRTVVIPDAVPDRPA
jgi:vacuolar-type H+-ATPase subunit H